MRWVVAALLALIATAAAAQLVSTPNSGSTIGSGLNSLMTYPLGGGSTPASGCASVCLVVKVL